MPRHETDTELRAIVVSFKKKNEKFHNFTNSTVLPPPSSAQLLHVISATGP